jgi:hypothetical protein
MFAGLCGIVSTLVLYRSAAPAPARVPASA